MNFEHRQKLPTLAELSEKYKVKLESILNTSLTVENINTFADDVLTSLISLTDEIRESYKTNPAFDPDISLSAREQEDLAFSKLELPNIQEILQQAIHIKEKIDSIKQFFDQVKTTSKVIIPPQNLLNPERFGSGEGFSHRILPRLITLLYILENDFEIPKEKINITEGRVYENMVRKTPYMIVRVPELNRLVYVCDEEGNITYVFDTEKLEKFGISTDSIDVSDKSKINHLISTNPGMGVRVRQTKNWRMNISSLLNNTLPENVRDDSSDFNNGNTKSEFAKKERGVYPTLEKFREEIAAHYPGKIGISTWYRTEVANHPNWPASPEAYYKDKGWVGFPELLGMHNRLKKDYLSFASFQDEVRSLYPGNGNIYKWYSEERKQHLNWPAKPEVTYAESGWPGWPELVGKEFSLRRELLPFDKFKEEIMALYPGEGGVQTWYNSEKVQHKNWPLAPQVTYAGKGWSGWPELVGKEELKFLSFEDFQSEVRAIYPGEGAIQAWYESEKKKHDNWPAAPYEMYKKAGWLGWPELVGKENLLKKAVLSFESFENAVRKLYPGNGDVQRWYKEERKKHPEWPSSPHVKYLNEGWKSWPELVGQKAKEIPSFETFQLEVRSVYPGKGNVSAWYRGEKIKHYDWPSAPEHVYKNKGWVGWSELVGLENPLKREFLPFDTFQAEVTSLCPKESASVKKWYDIEKIKHSNWPAAPWEVYKDEGWVGWPNLVGRENIFKREYKSFEDFQKEVLAFYQGQSDVVSWYKEERKKHVGWPSNPDRTYKNKGWTGWSAFVKKQ